MSAEHGHSAPPSSDPILGHGGTNYEGNDVKAPIVVWSLVIVAGLAVAGFLLMLLVQKYFEDTNPIGASPSALAPDRVIPPAPQVQIHPWEDLPEMREAEAKTLSETGRDQAGHMHIPIDAAMSEVLTKLKVDPNAPRGLTTPGGQGREYSHTLSERSGNERPQIQGEIHKNAQ
jgi:hypothetical protein